MFLDKDREAAASRANKSPVPKYGCRSKRTWLNLQKKGNPIRRMAKANSLRIPAVLKTGEIALWWSISSWPRFANPMYLLGSQKSWRKSSNVSAAGILWEGSRRLSFCIVRMGDRSSSSSGWGLKLAEHSWYKNSRDRMIPKTWISCTSGQICFR